eukprot:gene6253-biopygen6208
MSLICARKRSVHAMNFTIRIPPSASVTAFTRSSVLFTICSRIPVIFRTSFVCRGDVITITPSPANSATPTNRYSSTQQMRICVGADQHWCKFCTTSCPRCASVDMRLTIRPTLRSGFARVRSLRSRAFSNTAQHSVCRIRMPERMTMKKYWFAHKDWTTCKTNRTATMESPSPQVGSDLLRNLTMSCSAMGPANWLRSLPSLKSPAEINSQPNTCQTQRIVHGVTGGLTPGASLICSRCGLMKLPWPSGQSNTFSP